MPANALLLEVRLLGGRYHGNDDWPPSPFRLFQALVAASYGGRWATEPVDAKDRAFTWLEELEPPVWVAPMKIDGPSIKYWVPNNDLDAQGGDLRNVGEIRAGKTLRARILSQDAPILYAWPFDSGTDHALEIASLAERLHTLGLGIDMAFARGEVLMWGEAEERLHRTSDHVATPSMTGGGPADPTCPVGGSLASLKARHQAVAVRLSTEGDETYFRQPPKAHFRNVAYDRGVARVLFELRPADAARPFRPVRVERAAELSAWVRALATRRLVEALPARRSEILEALGSTGGASHLVGRRVQVMPLPSIGHRHAEPSIRRLLLGVPPDCPIALRDISWAISGQTVDELAAIDSGSGEILAETVLVPAEETGMLRHYGIGAAPARRWRTATPVLLPESAPSGRVGGATRAAFNSAFAGALATAVRNGGLDPRGLQVRVQPEPFYAKGARAETFAVGEASRRTLRHVELTFRDPIEGPLILGEGSAVGLGLFFPVEAGGEQESVVSPGRTAHRRSERPQVARFRLEAGPPIERAIEVASVMRLALMSKAKDPVPPELSGRDEDGPIRIDPGHVHTFYLPEDVDGDGAIDHVLLYCRTGFSRAARQAMNALDRLWISGRPGRTEDLGGEWRVGLECLACDGDGLDSLLLGRGRVWESVTPFLKPRFDKKRPADFKARVATYREQLAQEWGRRFSGLPVPEIEALAEAERFVVRHRLEGVDRSPEAFVRTRLGRGGAQPDRAGGFFRLVFPRPVEGPIALGKHAHFGMGLFRRSQR